MFKSDSKIINSTEDLSNYIQGYDLYNSLLLDRLRDPGLPFEYYEITVYEYRPDLIARDFYGSTDYLGLVLVQNGMGQEGYRRGAVLKLIPKNVLSTIISGI